MNYWWTIKRDKGLRFRLTRVCLMCVTQIDTRTIQKVLRPSWVEKEWGFEHTYISHFLNILLTCPCRTANVVAALERHFTSRSLHNSPIIILSEKSSKHKQFLFILILNIIIRYVNINVIIKLFLKVSFVKKDFLYEHLTTNPTPFNFFSFVLFVFL